MIRKVVTAIFIMLGVLIACSTSSSEKVEQPGIHQSSGDEISWTRFDDGLKEVSGGNKHMMAYFWRHG